MIGCRGSTCWLESERESERPRERRKAALGREARARRRRSARNDEPRRIHLRYPSCECLGELLCPPDQIDAQRAFEQRPFDCRAPRTPNHLGLEVDRLLALDDDPQGPATDRRDPNLSRARDEDRSDRMGEQSVLAQRGQVGDTVLAVAQRRPDSQREDRLSRSKSQASRAAGSRNGHGSGDRRGPFREADAVRSLSTSGIYRGRSWPPRT